MRDKRALSSSCAAGKALWAFSMLMLFLWVGMAAPVQAAPVLFPPEREPAFRPHTDSFELGMADDLRAMSLLPKAREWNEPWKVLLLLVEFDDKPAIAEPAYFEDMFFGRHEGFEGNYPYAHDTMADLYARMSGGLLTFDEPTTVGWLKAPKTYDYYASYALESGFPTDNGCYGLGLYAQGSNAGSWLVLKFALEEAVKQGVDLMDYDNDGDGIPEGIFLVHAGHGAEQTSVLQEYECEPGVRAGDFWSHQHINSFEGTMVRYLVGPQRSMASDDGLAPMGVWAHEFGHILGLPDLYAPSDGIGFGVGCWDLMGYGIRSCDMGWSGSDPGTDPNEMSTFMRSELGWLAPREVTENVCNREVKPLVSGGEAFKVTPNAAESWDYFLVEYRARLGFDGDLPGDLVCIWHVDERSNGRPGLPNRYPCQPEPGKTQPAPGACASRAEHYGLSLVQPDGQYSLEYAESYIHAGQCLGADTSISSRDTTDMLPWSGNADFQWTVRTGSLREKARISILVDDSAPQPAPRIATTPKEGAVRGTTWKYAPGLEAEAGLSEWKLAEGPNTMEIDAETGALTWKVPADFTGGEVKVSVRVTNCGGTTDQTFYLAVYDPVEESGCRTAGPGLPAALLAGVFAMFLRRRSSRNEA